MAQLSVLHDRVEMMFQGITNPANQGDLAHIRRTIERLPYSIAGVFRTMSFALWRVFFGGDATTAAGAGNGEQKHGAE